MKKIPVNRNFIWAEAFINQLCNLGVRYACISPGSRSTPLVACLVKQKKIKCFVHIDERVSGFFALGIAKATKLPVIVVTTSGTATSELYPAIIEAYQQRIPLLICTADRPPELLNTGANQTINQWNLYRNHIRWFKNVGLPELSPNRITYIKKIAIKSYTNSLIHEIGPVHLNFPFRKPLDKNSYTDEVDKSLIEEAMKPIPVQRFDNKTIDITKREIKQIDSVCKKLMKYSKGLIIIGPMNYDEIFIKNIKILSSITNYPILADGVSHLRFACSDSDQFVCSNYNAFLQSDKFNNHHKPEIVLQFGGTATSEILQNYIAETKPHQFIVNNFGDRFYPSIKRSSVIKTEPNQFCEKLILRLKKTKLKRKNKSWRMNFEKADELIENLKIKLINNSNVIIEPNIINTTLSCISSNTKIMVGNSLPIRDFDWFGGKTLKSYQVYFNRGASGIDGVTSTALGIASIKKSTILITGDLSFIHDFNALLTAKKYSIPLLVILINNNGGGIFNMLPGSSKKKSFIDYFITPHNLNISEIVNSFGLKHYIVKSSEELKNKIDTFIRDNSFTVLEIKTNSNESVKFRSKFWTNAVKKIEKEFIVK